MKKYINIIIAFVILIFCIWVFPKIISKFAESQLVIVGKAPSFLFNNQYNEIISNEDYKEKVYIVEFFFTTCSSICPIMNRKMVAIQDEFYNESNFGIASFTINPEKDTPEVLRKYAKNYKMTHINWHLLTGNKSDILKLSNEGFNLYASSEMQENGDFQHSGYFALVDKKGYIRCRKDKFNNPIIYYSALEDDQDSVIKLDQIKELKEDIKVLLKE